MNTLALYYSPLHPILYCIILPLQPIALFTISVFTFHLLLIWDHVTVIHNIFRAMYTFPRTVMKLDIKFTKVYQPTSKSISCPSVHIWCPIFSKNQSKPIVHQNMSARCQVIFSPLWYISPNWFPQPVPALMN